MKRSSTAEMCRKAVRQIVLYHLLIELNEIRSRFFLLVDMQRDLRPLAYPCALIVIPLQIECPVLGSLDRQPPYARTQP